MLAFSCGGVRGGNRFEYATMDAYFSKNQGQNSPFSKISGYVLTGPEATIALSFRLKNIYQKCDAKQFIFFFFCLLNLFFSSAFRLRRRRRGFSNSLVALPQKHASVQFLICDAGFHWKSGYLMENARRKRRPQLSIERPLIGSQGRLNKEGVMWAVSTVSNITEEPLQQFVGQAIQWAVY